MRNIGLRPTRPPTIQLRDTYVYYLVKKPVVELKIPGVSRRPSPIGEIVYIGITNDPGRREGEHRGENWVFTDLEVVSGPMLRSEAKCEEIGELARYYAIHKRYPKYNKKRYNIEI